MHCFLCLRLCPMDLPVLDWKLEREKSDWGDKRLSFPKSSHGKVWDLDVGLVCSVGQASSSFSDEAFVVSTLLKWERRDGPVRRSWRHRVAVGSSSSDQGYGRRTLFTSHSLFRMVLSSSELRGPFLGKHIHRYRTADRAREAHSLKFSSFVSRRKDSLIQSIVEERRGILP